MSNIKLYSYLTKLKYNNVDKIVNKVSQIKLIQLKNAHHYNILDQEELVLSIKNYVESIRHNVNSK